MNSHQSRVRDRLCLPFEIDLDFVDKAWMVLS